MPQMSLFLFTLWKLAMSFLFSVSFMMTLTANSWFSVWVGMEMMILTLMPLMVSSTNSIMNESAMKYFLVQILSGLLYLESMISSINLSWLFILSLMMKLGLAPFHLWVPHVFVGLTFPILGVVSILMKVPGLILIQHTTSLLVWVSVVLSVIIGSISGVFLTNIKKMLAYSSISHGGWLLAVSPTPEVWASYLMVYATVLWLFLFMVNKIFIKSITQTLMLSSPSQQLNWMILTFSLAGLPPLLGFSVKWLTLSYLSLGYGWVIVVLAVLFSFSLFYYTQMFILSLLSSNKTSKQNESFATFLVVSLTMMSTPLVLSGLELINF